MSEGYVRGPHTRGVGNVYAPGAMGAEAALGDHAEEILSEALALLLSKHADYGPRNIADSPGGPLNGLRVRMFDKLARINNLVDRDPEHESVEDSFIDMLNYSLIALLVLRGHWPDN